MKLIFHPCAAVIAPDNLRGSLRQLDDDAGYTKGTALSRDAPDVSHQGWWFSQSG
ncbi:hypothetical protein [Rhizobium sp. Leaf453]|uniref:hypothetical protein n=1 Tax=Rhizobium sp. Leaf453 TaxID=1736380 RepID=UPI000AB9993C|nr:hypothetical protein [Rhizobium sp. Leaf453]